MSENATSVAFAATIDAVARFTGKSPLVSTDAKEMHDISAALWRHSPCRRRFEGHECDILAVSLRGDATLEQIAGGRSIWRGPAPGSVVLLNSEEDTDWHIDGPFEMLHVYLPKTPALRDIRQSFPRLPFRDPLLLQIARSASLALMESGGRADCIGPLLDSMRRCFTDRCFANKMADTSPNVQGLTGFSRKLVVQFINDNLASDFQGDELARVAGLSPGHFRKAFRRSFGFSPHQFVLEQRVSRAAELLNTSNIEVAAIASLCGFSSHSHLTTEFRKRMGVTPREYRKLT